MFPVDAAGRISFIHEQQNVNDGRDSADAYLLKHNAAFRLAGRGKPSSSGPLSIQGRPAGTHPSPAPSHVSDLKKRIVQLSLTAAKQMQTQRPARKERASLDRLPELRTSTERVQGTPTVDKAERTERLRGKSLSPTQFGQGQNQGNSSDHQKQLVLRRPPLKPLALLPPNPEIPPAPPKASSTASSSAAGESPQISSKARTFTLKQPSVATSAQSQQQPPPAEQDAPIRYTKAFKYRFLPGNNGRVILQAFRKRPWWHAINVERNVDPAENEQIEYDFLWEMYRSAKRYKDETYRDCCLNHIQYNHSLVTKKGLYFTLRNYCSARNLDVLEIIPRTFYLHCIGRDDSHIGEGKKDDMDIFMEYNAAAAAAGAAATAASVGTSEAVGEEKNGNSGGSDGRDGETAIGMDKIVPPTSSSDKETGIVWICKPASLTNRGFGIQVLRGVDEVLALTQRAQSASSTGLEQARTDGTKPSSGALSKAARRRGQQEGWIVQEYLERPLLVSGRKFDIRCFVLLVMQKEKGNKDAKLKAYFYEDAYVRTSCKKYSLDKLSDRECHLTNDAVQKHAKGYGKFENGNKLTMEEWQTSLEKDYPDAPKGVVFGRVLPEIKRLSALSVSAGVASAKLGKTDISRSFELLGYDYMIDSQYRPLLIEVNSNPCLEFACPLLHRLITALIDNVFKVAVDTLCPPPAVGKRTRSCEEACAAIDVEVNKFEELTLLE